MRLQRLAPARAFAAVATAYVLVAGLAVSSHSAGAQPLLTEAAGADAGARGTTRTITVAGDWQVTCDRGGETSTCRMATVGAGQTGGGRQVTVRLASEAGAGADGLFFFLTPLDLLVAKGAEMRIDGGRSLKLAYRSCHSQGCVIPFRLTGSLAGDFRRGTKLGLRLFAIDGSAIDVELSLLGFIAAHRTMDGG